MKKLVLFAVLFTAVFGIVSCGFISKPASFKEEKPREKIERTKVSISTIKEDANSEKLNKLFNKVLYKKGENSILIGTAAPNFTILDNHLSFYNPDFINSLDYLDQYGTFYTRESLQEKLGPGSEAIVEEFFRLIENGYRSIIVVNKKNEKSKIYY